MPRTKGATNKTLRKDARLSRWAILKALEPIQGAYITSTMLQQMIPLKISTSGINAVLRKLLKEGVIKREGIPADTRGYVYTIQANNQES
jgi:predicted transcriptional regulator